MQGQPSHPISFPASFPLLPQSIRKEAYLWYQNLIPGSHANCNSLALLVQASRAYSPHPPLVELLDTALGQKNSSRGFRFRFDALDEDAVKKRGERLDGFQGGGLDQGLIL